MSDSDDIPDLVQSSSDEESSEEDENQQQIEFQAETWLEKDDKTLDEQENWWKVFCLGPFLFGVNSVLPAPWIQALTSAHLLINKDRQHMITYLQWPEWDCIDLLDEVIFLVQKFMREKAVLVDVLQCIQRLDSCITGDSDDVDRAIACGQTADHVKDLWYTLVVHGYSEKQAKATKFAVLYVLKIYCEHIQKFDFVSHVKGITKKSTSKNTPERETGNSHFKKGELEKAIECYTEAAKKEPFHHFNYGNRAQAYNQLKFYKEALADGRRAVTIKPDFAKGYYRYAVAFCELGRLDAAIIIIDKGVSVCAKVKDLDHTNLQDLKSLGENYRKKRSTAVLTAIPSTLDEQLKTLPENCEDLEVKFGVTKPSPVINIHKETAAPGTQIPNASSDSESEVLTHSDERHVRRKNKPKQNSKTNSKDSKKNSMLKTTVKSGNEILVNGLNEVNTQQDQLKRRRAQETRELMEYMSDGSDLLQKRASKTAMMSYQKALDMLAHNENTEYYGLDEVDVVTLKYAFGMAAINTGLYKSIWDGIEKFEDIIDNHQDIRFPPAYFGIGKGYVYLNRFPEAKKYLKSGQTIARNISYVHVTWPGSKTLVEESDPEILMKNMEELLQRCKFPPPPDAVCRYHTENDSRTVIYLSDPDFKGYVKITCQMACIITFHTVCWKNFKTNNSKQTDKDVLDTACPTPDCTGLVIKIEIVRQDSLSNKEHVSEKYSELKEAHKNKTKPPKQKPGESKQAKKHEKKEARKQKKRHWQEERGEKDGMEEKNQVIVDGASASAFVEEVTEVKKMPDMKDTIIYKKDEPIEKMQMKSKKSKKKKDRTKQIINLEVNFSDRKDEILLSENMALIDEDAETKSPSMVNPFSVPSDLKSQVSSFEQTYTGSNKPLFKPDEITDNLFSFFVGILQASGPLEVNDQRIQQELEVFPAEALDKIKQVGGLADFLRQSLKFAVIDDVISLMSDAVAAREYALKRRDKILKEGGPSVTQSAWKTVGKNSTIVDSLGESVRTSGSFPALLSSTSSNTQNSSSDLETPVTSAYSRNFSPVCPVLPTPPPQPQTNISMPSFVNKPVMSVTQKPASPGLDALDSIDDIPVQKPSVIKTRQLDDLDDFDAISDSGSEYNKQSRQINNKPVRDEDTISSSSSRSDISEKSLKSDFSTEQMPKPLKPLNAIGGLSRGLGPQKNSPKMWDKLEDDFNVSWTKSKKEEYSDVRSVESVGQSMESVGDELRQATEEFVRKSDEKFVSELAQSVVEKLFLGRKVPEDEKQKTLKQVSSDIWKDFEKSASSGKFPSGDMWANTPAGKDYSANMGKFANDFMKKYYEKVDDGIAPDSKTFCPPISPLDSFSAAQKNSPYSSPISSSWLSEDHSSPSINSPLSQNSSLHQTPPATSSFPPSTVSNFSGYNLFSGPTWGLDSFSKPALSTASTAFQHPPPPFIRPPHSAASYYQPSFSLAPRSSLSQPMPIQPQTPVLPINFPNMQNPTSSSCSIGIQCEPVCRSVETMTEPYEPFKQELVMMQQEREHAFSVIADTKASYDNLFRQYKDKEQDIKSLESHKAQQAEEIHKYTAEKRQAAEEQEILQSEILQLKDLLNIKTSSEKELRDKMTGQEQKVNELAVLAKDQREKDLCEIKRYRDTSEALQHKHNEQWKRAVAAEIEILKGRLQNDKSRLSRAQKDAAYHLQYLGAVIKKHKDEMKPVPQQLTATNDYWYGVREKTEEALRKLQDDYEARMEEVRGGKVLSDIAPVKISSPAPMPEHLKPLMNNQGQQSQPGFIMPRMPGPAGAGFPPQSSAPSMSLPIGGTNGFPALPSTMSAPPPPRPLTQWSNSQGAPAPPRPLSGARAPLVPPSRCPLRPLGAGGAQTQMSSFEKLILRLQTQFPNYSRQDFSKMIQELRKDRGGSLSGMTMEDIITRVEGKLKQHASPFNSVASPVPKPLQTPPGLNPSWAFHVAGKKEAAPARGLEVFEDEEDPCVICHEEMEGPGKSTVTLECNHKFHDECIRKWFQEQSTCPNCRVHTLLADEFPSLG